VESESERDHKRARAIVRRWWPDEEPIRALLLTRHGPQFFHDLEDAIAEALAEVREERAR
jgi:hypothetical protein